MQQSPTPVSLPHDENGDDLGGGPAEAPPKLIAIAMERLCLAASLIADVRLGADRLLESLLLTGDHPQEPEQSLNLILKEESSMHQRLQDLRVVGRQLDASGVLNGMMRSRGNAWGLHVPLICPDGAVVAYAWKRQLAGQAATSAVDKTRLALKAFADQKKRFFPHLEGALTNDRVVKKHSSVPGQQELRHDDKKLSDVLAQVKEEAPNVKIFTYQRLDWLNRASSLSSANERCLDPSSEQSCGWGNPLKSSPLHTPSMDQIAVIELFVPSVFRAVVSLHPAGSLSPDAVAFFSPDEGGSHVHSRGVSVYYVFRQITKHACSALQYFWGTNSDASLSKILHWIILYQTLFTEVCGNCGRLLMMDRQSAVLLPPVLRLYCQMSPPTKSHDSAASYHADCLPEEGDLL